MRSSPISADKPLHARVAEALGRHVDLTIFPPGCYDTFGDVPRYDTDWSATGPLIEKYKITVDPQGDGKTWFAKTMEPCDCGSAWTLDEGEEGPTPLLAVCHLILALKDAGKLCA